MNQPADNRHCTEDWRLYEALKADWLRRHPDATPAEYAAALTRIARECGV